MEILPNEASEKASRNNGYIPGTIYYTGVVDMQKKGTLGGDLSAKMMQP